MNIIIVLAFKDYLVDLEQVNVRFAVLKLCSVKFTVNGM